MCYGGSTLTLKDGVGKDTKEVKPQKRKRLKHMSFGLECVNPRSFLIWLGQTLNLMLTRPWLLADMNFQFLIIYFIK